MMKKIRSTLMSMAAGLVTAAALLCSGIARADGPTFTIVNQSGDTENTAQYYYLGYAQLKQPDKKPNDFMILLSNGSWAKAGSQGTQWNPKAWNWVGKSGAGVVPCYQLKGGETVNLPSNLISARLYFFRVPANSPWYSSAGQNLCNATPVQGPAKKANGLFGNVLYNKMPTGNTNPNVAPFAYRKTTDDGGLTGQASPAMITQNSLPVYSFVEAGGPNPKDTYPVADIDASMVDLIGFPINIIAQIDRRVVNSSTSTPTGEGVGFSFSKDGGVNMSSIMNSYTNFVGKLSKSEAQDYNYLKVTPPNNGGSFLVNPGNYFSYINPSSTAFSDAFGNLVNNYMWSPKNPTWKGTIDLGGAFQYKKLPATPYPSPFAGQAVQLDSNKAFPNYKGKTPLPSLYAIKFTSTPSGVDSISVLTRGTGYTSPPTVTLSAPQASGGVQATATAKVSAGKITSITMTNTGFGYTSPPTVTIYGAGSGGAGKAVLNTKTFIAYLLSPASYAELCELKVISSCPANLSVAYQVFGGAGAFDTPGIEQWNMLKALHPNAANDWRTYGGFNVYSQIVARLGFITSSAFNRGVAGGLPTPGGLCEAYDNISYCWSDQKNWYPNGSNLEKSKYFNGDTTQNQFSRWLHTYSVPPTTGTPIVTRPTEADKHPTSSGDVLGMAYGFSNDENPTPQVPEINGKPAPSLQTPSEYSSNVLSGITSLASKNCITIMPYNQYKNPAPPSTSCIPQ